MSKKPEAVNVKSPRLILITVAFLALLLALLVTKVQFSRRSESAQRPEDRPTSAPGSGPAQLPVKSQTRPPGNRPPRAVGTSSENILENAKLSLARDTFGWIEREKEKFKSGSNGRKRLDGLQQKLFLNDYAYAARFSDLKCEGAGEAFEQLSAAPKENSSSPPPTADAEALAPDDPLYERYSQLLSSGTAGYSNILQSFAHTEANPLRGQLFMDGCVYVGLKSYLEGVMADDARHSAAAVKALKTSPDRNGVSLSASYQASAAEESAEMKEVLRSYRAIFQQRWASELGDEAALILDRLEPLQLNATGPELTIPCR